MFGSRLKRARLLQFAVSLFVALAACACARSESSNTNAGGAASAPASGAPKPGSSSALPPEIATSTVKSLDGDEFTLADYKGKVVVLDLWATWCGPCRVEIPHLVRFSEEYRGRGVEVIGLSTEEPEEAAGKVRDFAREYNINYKLGWTNEEIEQLIVYGRGVIPQTLVIAPDGVVVMHHAGFDPRSTPQKLREAIEQALARQS